MSFKLVSIDGVEINSCPICHTKENVRVSVSFFNKEFSIYCEVCNANSFSQISESEALKIWNNFKNERRDV